jgi:predicted Rossmann fold nucleotide-binding protein DprA/Smf involved in DNA uptake
MNLLRLSSDDPKYPARLHERLGSEAPKELQLLGNPDLLGLPKTALCSSVHCPGVAIHAAYDQAAKWRDAGACVISGFHSPMEKECLRILLRGPQPLIICPARSLEHMRVPREWDESLRRGRLLVLSAFGPGDKRMTAALAARRNELVAALADEVWIAHLTPGGETARLAGRLAGWGVPVCRSR